MEPEALVEVFREKPALHRYPGSMAKRTHALCQMIVDELRRRRDEDLAGRQGSRGPARTAPRAPRLRRGEGEDLPRPARQAVRARAGRVGRSTPSRSPTRSPGPWPTSTPPSRSSGCGSGSGRRRRRAAPKPTPDRRSAFLRHPYAAHDGRSSLVRRDSPVLRRRRVEERSRERDFETTPKSRRERARTPRWTRCRRSRRGLRERRERAAPERGSSSSKAPRRRPPPRPPMRRPAAITSCSQIPDETAGPFPADGTNGPNILTENGVVRRDITLEHRLGVGRGRGRAADGQPHDRRQRQRVRGAARCGRLHLALRPGRRVLDVLAGRRRTRTTCAACRWPTPTARVTLHHHLPRGLLGPLAAHPLRGVPEPGRGDERRQRDGGLAARAAGRRLHGGVRDRRLRAERRATSPRPRSQTDMVFSDGASLQTPTMTGDTTSGYTAALVVGV